MNWKAESWQKAMRMRVDFNYMMEEFTGAGRGIAKSALESKRGAALAAHKAVELKRGKGWLEWMSSPYDQGEVVKEINAMAADIREKNDYFVVLGIGGSALGPSAVQKALNHIHYNDLPKAKRPGPIFYVEDNIDPERMQALLDVIDIQKTVFNVISKSGNTSETMSQFLIVKKLLEDALGADAKDHIICTTSSHSGSLLPSRRRKATGCCSCPTAWADVSPSFARWVGCRRRYAVSTSRSFWPARPTWISCAAWRTWMRIRPS